MAAQEGAYRILIVLAEPDGRISTDRLHLLHQALERRPDVEVQAWFLRDYHGFRWPGSRSVDRLRSSPVNRLLEGVGLGTAAAFVRGRRLRWWFRTLDPDLVILDDGYGARLLPAATRRPLVAVRDNPVAGADYGFDEERLEDGDLRISDLPMPEGWQDADRWLQMGGFLDELDGAVPATIATSGAGRGGFGVPEGVPLVVGWGEDSWLDGADLFVRTLWFLEHRCGIEAWGAWILPDGDPEVAQRLEGEIERCGLSGRVRLVPEGADVDPWSADVLLLPRRTPLEVAIVCEAGRRQRPVVTFDPPEHQAPWVSTVPLLDLAAMARAVVGCLEGRFTVPPERWPMLVDPDHFADALLAAVDRAR